MKKIILILLAASILGACSNKDSEETKASDITNHHGRR